MTEQQAKKHLYELWETGELPNNFDENHTDYYRAVNYTMEKDKFSYDEFYDSMVIISFGEWEVQIDALVHKDNKHYIIQDSRFWETSEFNGHIVWDWLIHLTEKGWVTPNNIMDLNNAFFFCQDYFRKLKPSNLPYVSTAQTLNIQKQLMTIREEMAKSRRNINGILDIKNEDMLKYRELMNNITYI